MVESRLVAVNLSLPNGDSPPGFRILIFQSILIYQHFHPEPVEGLHPLALTLSFLLIILSLSKDGLSTTSVG